MKFTSKPRYIPDSIELFFLGDILHRTQGYCPEPFNPNLNLGFINEKKFNETINLIITERFVSCALRALETSISSY